MRRAFSQRHSSYYRRATRDRAQFEDVGEPPPEILRHRELTIARLRILLRRVDSHLTVDEVTALVFEADVPFFNTYVRVMLEALKTNDPDEEALDMMQDLWNFLPHRFLGGKCPEEAGLGLMGTDPV